MDADAVSGDAAGGRHGMVLPGCCHGEWVVTADEVTARPAEEAGDDWLSWLHLLLAEGQSSPAPETTNKLT